MKTVEILDTGLNRVGGQQVFARADTEWLEIPSSRLQIQESVSKTDNAAQRVNVDGFLTFQANEVTQFNTPMVQIWGLFPIDEHEDLLKLRTMIRSLGVKYIRGGPESMIASTPEAFEYNGDWVLPILIFNSSLSISAINASGKKYASITLQCEVV